MYIYAYIHTYIRTYTRCTKKDMSTLNLSNIKLSPLPSGYMESTMATTTAQSTPPQQVDQLIQMVADEAGLTIAGQLDGAGSTGSQLPSPNPIQEAPVKKEDDLEARLAALRK